MPRDKQYCCGTCFFSHNPTENETYEYWECQFEAHKSVTDSGEEADFYLPRVHKDSCVCRYWTQYESLATLPLHFN